MSKNGEDWHVKMPNLNAQMGWKRGGKNGNPQMGLGVRSQSLLAPKQQCLASAICILHQWQGALLHMAHEARMLFVSMALTASSAAERSAALAA